MKTQVAVYARYSTDLQSERSLEDQVDLCKRYARQQGWEVVAVYQDAAVSGTTNRRPGYQRLLGDLPKGRFDILLAEAIDRLTRDQEDLHALVKRLNYHEVELHTCASGKADVLHVGITGIISAQFVADIALKTHRGLAGRVREGKSGGGRCYGYDIVRKVLPDGSVSTGERSINERQAKVVRRIFGEYANGVSPKRIARRLNRDGIPSPRDGTWVASTLVGTALMGTGILNNELYIGKMVWNRTHTIKHPTTRRKRARINPRNEWVVCDVPDLRIVSDELWDKVAVMKVKLRERMGPLARRGAFNRAVRPRFLLSGLVKCAECGGNYISHNGGWWRCSNHVQRRTCPNTRGIKQAELEERVFGSVKQNLLQERLFRHFIREFGKAVRAMRANAQDRRGDLAAQLETVSKRIANIVAAVEQGQAYDSLVSRLGVLEAEKKRLQAEVEAAQAEVAIPSPDMARAYAEKVRDLVGSLEVAEDDAGAREAVREMIEQVTISPTPGKKPVGMRIRGNLVSALGTGASGTPAGKGKSASWVQTLAGVGFEPTTFRL